MKVAYWAVLLLLCGFLLSGCGHSSNAQQTASINSVQKGELLPNGSNTAHLTVIRNETDWAAFWDLLYANHVPKPARPPVNFAETAIVALVDSQRPTGGYSVTITDIKPTSSGISVMAAQVSPGPACMVTQALTQPFHVVSTAAFSGTATLELSHSVSNCGP